MKIAISSQDGKKDAPISPQFGRCSYFVFVDTETQAWGAQENPAAAESGGAGTKVVQFLAAQQVDAAITGRYGPMAFTALQEAGIEGYEAEGGTPEELYEKFLAGELKKATSPSATGRHHH